VEAEAEGVVAEAVAGAGREGREADHRRARFVRGRGDPRSQNERWGMRAARLTHKK